MYIQGCSQTDKNKGHKGPGPSFNKTHWLLSPAASKHIHFVTCWLHVTTEMPKKAFCLSFLRKEIWLELCTSLHINLRFDIQSYNPTQNIIYTRSRMNLQITIYIVFEKIGPLSVPTYHLCRPKQIMHANRCVTKSLLIISNQKNCAALSWLVGLVW